MNISTASQTSNAQRGAASGHRLATLRWIYQLEPPSQTSGRGMAKNVLLSVDSMVAAHNEVDATIFKPGS